MSGQEKLFFAESLKIFFTISAYWLVSISMVFLNKYVLSSEDVKLDAPFFTTWFQCVISLLLCLVSDKLMGRSSATEDVEPFRWSTTFKVLPLSFCFVAMISFNNLCLKFVGVAFYTVGRSLTTVFNVVLSWLILRDIASWKALLCCTVIFAGFFIGVREEKALGSLSVIGVIFGVLASISVALNAIYTKRILPVVRGSVQDLLFYNSLNACFLLFIILALCGELYTLWWYPNLLSGSFWIMMVCSGILGYFIGIVSGMQVKYTSPLTHNISGTAKACAQTVIACVYYTEYKPFLWWLSNVTVLGGSAAYTIVRRQEMKNRLQEEQLLPDAKPVA